MEFNQKVAELANVDARDIETLSLEEVLEQVVLPKIAKVGGEKNRQPRISQSYMDFMAQFGHFIHFNLDTEVANVAFELGLQRLSKGGICPLGIDLVDILPDYYKIYSAKCDADGPFDKECWEFFKTCLPVMFRSMKGMVARHVKMIVFAVMEHVDEDGTSDMQFDENVAGVTLLELRKLVEPYATIYCSEDDRWKYVMVAKNDNAYRWVKKCNAGIVPIHNLTKILAPKWSQNKAFFKDFFGVIDWKMMAGHINFDGETFYTGWTRKLLKLFGLYDVLTMKKIKAEIEAFK